MEHFEIIEKLCGKAGVTREEAADALTRANWDMLEALVLLEQDGKIPPLTSSVATVTPARSRQSAGEKRSAADGDAFIERTRDLLEKSLAYSFIVRRQGKEVLYLPVLVGIAIVLASFRLSALALVLGLCFGCRYSVEKRAQ